MSNKDNNHIVDVNKKISSVDWLIEQLTFKCSEGQRLNNYNDWVDLTDYCAQAKAMHKEEIDEAYRSGVSDEREDTEEEHKLRLRGEYHNQTYGE